MNPRSRLLELVRRRRKLAHPVAVVAHRGDKKNAPENTLPAFRQAVEAGADVVEFDLQLTSDGEIVIHHDAKLGRCVPGRGKLRAMTLDAIRALDAGRKFDVRFEGERVPTLDEVLDYLLAQDVVPMMEIKGRYRRVAGIEDPLQATLRNHRAFDRVVVIVHDRLVSQAVRTTCEGSLVALLSFTKRSSRFAAREGFDGVIPYWRALSLKLVGELHEKDVFLSPWTVNRVKDMERVLRLGVDAIVTDDPALLREVVDSAPGPPRPAITPLPMSLPVELDSDGDIDLEALDSDECLDPSPDELRLKWLTDSGEWSGIDEPPEGEDDSDDGEADGDGGAEGTAAG